MASQGMEVDNSPTPAASSQASVGNGDSTSDNDYENATLRNMDRKVYIQDSIFDPEASRKELANLIIMHKYPISIVEHHGFIKLSTSLQPRFKVPSQKTVMSDIMKIYAAGKSKNMDILRKCSSRVAISMNMWTASDQMKRYMAIMAHFIDNKWNLQDLMMRVIYVPCANTSDVISKELLKCIFDWNIEGKLSTLTFDNCSINDGTIDTVISKLNPSHPLLHGKLSQMHCCVHVLNSIVQDGLNAIGDELERIRDSVAFWTATPTRHRSFKETVRLLGIEYSKKLVLDCMTRWDSTYLMLSIALEYKDVFSHLKQQEPLFTCAPHEEDWVLIEDICKILHQFYTSMNSYLGKKSPTSNILSRLMYGIKRSLDTWITSSSLTIKIVGESMLAKFDKYWKDVHDIMAVASVLDPRYKLLLTEFYFSKLYGELANDETQRIRKYCYDLFHEYENSSLNVSKENELGRCSSDSKLPTYLHNQRKESLKSELDRYFEEGVRQFPRDIDFDILNWWNCVRWDYPVLQKIAKDILAIQISTVTSESVFCTSSRLLSPHQSKLQATTLEALMCAQNWSLKDISGECPMEEDAGCTSDDEFL